MSRQVLEDLIKTGGYDRGAIEAYLKERGIELEEQDLFAGIVKMRFLDSYATSFFREQA